LCSPKIKSIITDLYSRKGARNYERAPRIKAGRWC
jgi:hypothetical protein